MDEARLSRGHLGVLLRKVWRWAATWLPVAAWLVVIFVLSGRPDQDISDGVDLGKGLPKLAHLVEYVVLAMLLVRALGASAARGAGLWVMAFVALYAISDELHQSLVPGRTPLATDVVIDIVGGSLGWLLWRAWAGRPRRLPEVS